MEDVLSAVYVCLTTMAVDEEFTDTNMNSQVSTEAAYLVRDNSSSISWEYFNNTFSSVNAKRIQHGYTTTATSSVHKWGSCPGPCLWRSVWSCLNSDHLLCCGLCKGDKNFNAIGKKSSWVHFGRNAEETWPSIFVRELGNDLVVSHTTTCMEISLGISFSNEFESYSFQHICCWSVILLLFFEGGEVW